MFLTSHKKYIWFPHNLVMKQPGMPWVDYFFRLKRHLDINNFHSEDITIHVSGSEMGDLMSHMPGSMRFTQKMEFPNLSVMDFAGMKSSDTTEIFCHRYFSDGMFLGIRILNDIPEVK